jgi:predicted Rossmann fold flavoprotein
MRGAVRTVEVAIVGGGAAGLAAAIEAARDGASVVLLEASSRVGHTVLATGNGRCNLTNTTITGVEAADSYRNAEFVSPSLESRPCEEVLAWFGTMGLVTFASDQGYVYPASNAASSVLDVLRLELAHLAVSEMCGFEVVAVRRNADTAASARFEVSARDGRIVRASTVIVATGGGESLLMLFGHGLTPCSPVLTALATKPAPIKGLSGIKVRCTVELLGSGRGVESGELLFREYGVSGIAVFNLSRFAQQGSVLRIDLAPQLPLAKLVFQLDRRKAMLGWRSAGAFLEGMLKTPVSHAVLRSVGISPDSTARDIDLAILAAALKRFDLEVTGFANVKHAQVTRGGAVVSEFDATTMASKLVPGLFAAGEVLDVDAGCGGYNLHWAWASGCVAGRSAAREACRTEWS